VTAAARPYGPANRTALLATMVGCEPVYSALSNILQPDVTPPTITAVSVATACSEVDPTRSMLEIRVSMNVSEPAEVRNTAHHRLQGCNIRITCLQLAGKTLQSRSGARMVLCQCIAIVRSGLRPHHFVSYCHGTWCKLMRSKQSLHSQSFCLGKCPRTVGRTVK
jgi:hypothetical protein